MASKLNKVFVYGTLKKGEPNHGWFSKSPGGYHKFLCNGQTNTKFPLVIATKYNIPFLLYEPGQGNRIKGEIYEVDDKVFADLDVLEDYPKWYTRELQQVQNLDDGDDKSIQAWTYFIKGYRSELLKQKMYDCYSSNNTDGLKYVPRYERLRSDPDFNFKKDVKTDI